MSRISASAVLDRPHDVEQTGDDSPAHSLWTYVWRMTGWHQVYVCGLALLLAGLSFVPLELQRRIIDGAITDGDYRLVLVLGGLYLVVLLATTLTKFVLRTYQGWLGESAVRYTRAHLVHVHECRHATRTSAGDGQAVSVIGSEVEKLGGFVGEGISQPLVNTGMTVVILAYMVVVEPLLTVFCLPFLLPQLVIVPWLQRHINRRIEERVDLLRDFSSKITHEDELKTPAMKERLRSIFSNRMRIHLLKALQKASLGLLNGLAPLSALVIGGCLVIEGEVTVGTVVAFMSGFDRLGTPLRELIANYRQIAQANVQHDMIARWI